MATLARIGRFALDLLYPPACALCGRAGALLCDACRQSLAPADGLRCPTCWLPLPNAGRCYNCSTHPLALTALRSVCRYDGPARELVHAFKFRDLSALAEVMAPAMAALVDWPVDIVVPVPLSRGRERERGYNQSHLLAKPIAAALGVPEALALKRTRSGRTQARSASAEERRANVKGAFAVRSPELVAGRSVLLVDDVATTAATLNACAAALLGAGAAGVSAITFARED